MKNTVWRLLTELDQRIDFYDQRPSLIYDRWYRHGFDLPIKRAQQFLTHAIITARDFAVDETSHPFSEIVHLYCRITRHVIQYLRQEEPDPDDPDGFFEVHLQPLMEGALIIELDKIAELLQRYRENQGQMKYPYRPEQNESLEYTQYELTAALNTRNVPMQNPQQMQDIICEHWTWRTPFMELKRYYVPFGKEIWNEYSIHSGN